MGSLGFGVGLTVLAAGAGVAFVGSPVLGVGARVGACPVGEGVALVGSLGLGVGEACFNRGRGWCRLGGLR